MNTLTQRQLRIGLMLVAIAIALIFNAALGCKKFEPSATPSFADVIKALDGSASSLRTQKHPESPVVDAFIAAARRRENWEFGGEPGLITVNSHVLPDGHETVVFMTLPTYLVEAAAKQQDPDAYWQKTAVVTAWRYRLSKTKLSDTAPLQKEINAIQEQLERLITPAMGKLGQAEAEVDALLSLENRIVSAWVGVFCFEMVPSLKGEQFALWRSSEQNNAGSALSEESIRQEYKRLNAYYEPLKNSPTQNVAVWMWGLYDSLNRAREFRKTIPSRLSAIDRDLPAVLRLVNDLNSGAVFDAK